jgi:hypothetical protein
MNFNLISPPGKADNFTINFRDPIKIKPNSKIDLNWIELKRKGEVVLDSNQRLTITSTKCLPDKIPGNTATNNEIAFNVDIPLGVYEFSEFQDLLEQKINEALTTETTATRLVRYQAAGLEGNSYGFGSGLQNDGVLGLCLAPTDFGSPGLSTIGDQHDAEQATTGGDTVFYTTHNNTGTYDNYANSDFHFDFYRGDCKDEIYEQNAIAIMEGIESTDNQVGGIGFGLTGIEYTQGIAPTPTRTNGDNPPVLHTSIPATFIWVECEEAGGDLNISVAERTVGGVQQPISEWNDQNYEITGMRLVHRIPMAQAFNTVDKPKLLFQTELLKNTTDSPEIRWKVFNNQDATNPDLIYDSNSNQFNLPFKLLLGTQTAYTNARAVNSQIPFGFQFAAQNQNQGWKRFDCAYLDKDDGANIDDDNPYTILRDYNITMTTELANILSVGSDGVINGLHPNVCQEQAQLVTTDLDLNWKGKNYSVFINLPCNNYKNVEEQSSGGFKKSILANLPSPFTTGTIVAEAGSNTGQVVSIYQPYTPITSNLENNEINTNIIEIKVVDMLTEQLADQLTSTVLNFTISEK